MDIIHINGRIYDPVIGRMLQSDPIIQVPEFILSYNRYSYVWNNPMNRIDPAEYELEGGEVDNDYECGSHKGLVLRNDNVSEPDGFWSKLAQQ